MAEDKEDWFYQSILRYKSLNMFELEYPVHQMELTNYSSICVSCSNTKQHHLLELSLPQRIASQVNNTAEVAISNDTDLKIKCGSFTNSMVSNLKPLHDNNKVLTSHQNKYGVIIYKLPSDGSDEIKRDSFLKCELESPTLALNGTKLMLTRDNSSPKLLIDVNNGLVLGKIPPDQLPSDVEQSVFPTYLEPSLVAICNQSSGQVQLYDTREFKVLLDNCVLPEEKGGFWNFNSSFGGQPAASEINSTFLAMLSNTGMINVYDSRKWKTPYLKEQLNIKTSNKCQIQLQFKPSDPRFISFTGIDSNVYVYQLHPKPELVFVHDGHIQVEGCSKTITSSHAWIPNIENTIISTAHNGTVQVWQFEDKR